MNVGGVILCGGKSSRMGRAKALLPVGEELMLQRVARIVGSVARPVVVVAGPDQQLPDLPEEVRVVRDEREYLGPLAGLGIGLRALAGDVEAAYCSSCDAPLLQPEFIVAMIALLGDHDAAVPKEERFYHPLAGVYRTALAENVERLVAEERLRPLYLIESVRTRAVPVDELRTVDPTLDSLRNVNTPEEYAAVVRVIEERG